MSERGYSAFTTKAPIFESGCPTFIPKSGFLLNQSPHVGSLAATPNKSSFPGFPALLVLF